MAWACEAEDHFNDGLGCYFEIRGMDTHSGAPAIVTISAEGYDVENFEDGIEQ